MLSRLRVDGVALSRDAPKAPPPTRESHEAGRKHKTPQRRHEPSYWPSVSPTPRPSHAPSYSPTVDPTFEPTSNDGVLCFLGAFPRRWRRWRRGAAAERTTPPSTREQHKRPRRIYPTYEPSTSPTPKPSPAPTSRPSPEPSYAPTVDPTFQPTLVTGVPFTRR